jgi:hypothetical protein
LITATFSRAVNGFISANFAHEFGLPATSFTDCVGVPKIQHFSDPDSNHGIDPDEAFINIPHIHHGRDKYGAQDWRLRRVLDMTMQMTFLVGHIAMQTLDQQERCAEDQPTRLELCQSVMSALDDHLASDAGMRFKLNFDQAKLELREWFAKGFHRMISEDVRPFLNSQGTARLAELGHAAGAPNSHERLTHLNELWDKNFPDLRLVIPREDSQKQEWINSFMGLAEGQSYLLKVISVLDEDGCQTTLSEQLRPEKLHTLDR